MKRAATDPARWASWQGVRDPLAWIGILGGCFAPLFCALVYKTYVYTLHGFWIDISRQLGLPYVVVELGVIGYAWRRGLNASATWRALGFKSRLAVCWFLSTFWLSSVLTSAWSSFSTALCAIWVVHMLFGVAVYQLAMDAKFRGLAPFSRGFAFGLALLIPCIAFQFLVLPQGMNPEHVNWDASIPGFISARLFGAWCGAVAAMLLGLLWYAEPNRARSSWLFASLFLALALMLWTGTRAAVLGVAVAGVASISALGRPYAKGAWGTSALALAFGLLTAVLLQPYGDVHFSVFRMGTHFSAEELSSGRLAYWLAALRAGAQHPWLGSGAGAAWWLVPYSPGFYHVQPHNLVVQFFLTWGVIGALPMLAILAALTWKVHRDARFVPATIPAVMMLDCLITIGLVDGMFHFSQFLMLVAACYGFCLAAAKLHAESLLTVGPAETGTLGGT